MVKTHKNVTLLPLTVEKFGWCKGGLYDVDNRPIRDWPLLGSNGSKYPKPARQIADQYSANQLPEGFFGGYWSSYFGHFIAETFPNIAALKAFGADQSDLPIYFLSLEGEDFSALSSFAKFFLTQAGLDERRFRIIRDTSTVSMLHLPPAPFLKKFSLNPKTVEWMDDILVPPSNRPTRNVFFTRKNFPQKGLRLKAERELDAFFASKGFEVISPENLCIEEQISLSNEVKVLAGVNGSALHWSLYSRSIQTVVCLGWHMKLQQSFCDVRDQAYVSIRGKGLKRFAGRKNRDIPIDYIEQRLLRGIPGLV